MSYQVLALKYRPQTFDEVIGQSHVTATLSNAISIDRVAHAILFTGPRGTGKTTIARILAKAMNCENGPTVSPCNQCKICREIIDGHCSDVFEIDGASNNSVDQIRDLRENVTYMPSTAQYKIYIIDEVHMLSTAAFNALLKTLEEPPDHVLFIFATTEVHKIPATILSRCQRHDLGRIDLPRISGHLKTLGQKEGYTIEQKTLDLVAQEADGSIRDALSLFDRVLSSCHKKNIAHEHVLDILGVLDQQVLIDVASAIVEKDGAELIRIIETVNDSGLDLKRFYSDIITFFRNLTIIKHCGRQSSAVNIPESQQEMLVKFGERLSPGFVNDILNTMLNQENLIRYSSHTRFSIEMTMLRLLELNPAAQIDQIITQLDTLAGKLGQMPHAGNGITSISTAPPKAPQKNEPAPAETGPASSPTGKRPAKENIPPHSGVQNHTPSPEKKNSWRDYLGAVEKSNPFMFALLQKSNIIDKNNEIRVEMKGCSSFDVKRIDGKKAELSAICRKMLNKDLNFVVLSENNTVKTESKKREKMQARQAAFNHPLVVKAQKLFDGKIINF